jgi:hypothetical protein
MNPLLLIYNKKNFMNYDIIVYIDKLVIKFPVRYESEYELRRDITNLGTNGIIRKEMRTETDNDFYYFPPHKIDKIEVKEIKP